MIDAKTEQLLQTIAAQLSSAQWPVARTISEITTEITRYGSAAAISADARSIVRNMLSTTREQQIPAGQLLPALLLLFCAEEVNECELSELSELLIDRHRLG